MSEKSMFLVVLAVCCFSFGLGLVSSPQARSGRIGMRPSSGQTRVQRECRCEMGGPMESLEAIQHVRTLQDMSSSFLAAGMSSAHYAAPVYFVAGGICCSFSHAVAIPLDVVKTRQQTNKTMASFGMSEALKVIVKEDGPMALMQGAGPTIVGYTVQGAMKYGLYEALKPAIAAFLGSLAMFYVDPSIPVDPQAGPSASTLLDYVLAGKSSLKFLYTVDILCHVEWCNRQLWCSSIISFNVTSIAYN